MSRGTRAAACGAGVPLSERAFQAQVVRLAELLGWLWFHPHDSRRSPAGFPDLVLVRPPRVVLVELKTDRGRVRPEQRVWLDAVAGCPGVETHLWRPRDWPAIEAALGRPR